MFTNLDRASIWLLFVLGGSSANTWKLRARRILGSDQNKAGRFSWMFGLLDTRIRYLEAEGTLMGAGPSVS